jgi:5-methylcytosine-specific restriction protein A
MANRTVNYCVIHEKTKWRRVRHHSSLDAARYGKDGAPALFSGKARIDYTIHGKPLFVVIWEDNSNVAYVSRLGIGGRIDEVEISILFAQAYDNRNGATISEIENHFREAVTEQSDDISLDIIAIEGEANLVTHLVRERNAELVNKKKSAVLAAEGKLSCEVCSFDFSIAYGNLGQGFCEVHHLNPIGARVESSQTPLSELAILCANCHSMIHRTNPMWPPEKLKATYPCITPVTSN